MRRLDKSRTKQFESSMADLAEKQDALNEAVLKFNGRTEQAWNKLSAAVEEFNAERSDAWGGVDVVRDEVQGVIDDLESLREEVNSDQESYASEKSDKWQESDAGSLYREWADKWAELLEIDLDPYSSEPDPLEVEQPEDMDQVEESWADLAADAYTLDPDGDTASPEVRVSAKPEKPAAVGKMTEAEQKTLAHEKAKVAHLAAVPAVDPAVEARRLETLRRCACCNLLPEEHDAVLRSQCIARMEKLVADKVPGVGQGLRATIKNFEASPFTPSVPKCDKECGAVMHMTGGLHRTDCAAYVESPAT